MRASLFIAACTLALVSNVATARHSRVAHMVRAHKAEHLKPTEELMRFAARAEHATKKSLLMKDELMPCGNCVYVMERIKSRQASSLNGICLEVFSNTHSQTEYGTCHNVAASLGPNSGIVEKWIDVGCPKVEPYGGRSIVSPCPSHTMCAHLRNLERTAFCKMPQSDYVNEVGDTLGEEDGGDDDASDDDSADDSSDDTPSL